MSKKQVKSLKGEVSNLSIVPSGQHVGIRNTEHFIGHGVIYETPLKFFTNKEGATYNVTRLPQVGDEIVLPEDILGMLSMIVHDHPDIYFGIIYPKDKKFNQKKWKQSIIAQELASFTKISQIIHWGESTYITMVRNYEDKDLEYLHSIAWNWEE